MEQEREESIMYDDIVSRDKQWNPNPSIAYSFHHSDIYPSMQSNIEGKRLNPGNSKALLAKPSVLLSIVQRPKQNNHSQDTH